MTQEERIARLEREVQNLRFALRGIMIAINDQHPDGGLLAEAAEAMGLNVPGVYWPESDE